MNIHKNAVLTPHGREEMVLLALEPGPHPEGLCSGLQGSVRTASKCIATVAWRLYKIAPRGPKRLYRPTCLYPQEEVVALRRERLTGYAIAKRTGLSRATVSRVLRRARLSRWRDLVPSPLPVAVTSGYTP